MNKIEVFEKYAKEGAIPTEISGVDHKVNIYKKVWTLEEFEQAIQNGDLFTKEQVERAKLEGKIEGIKAVKDYCFESDTIPLTRLDFYSFTESVLETLETRLKEIEQ